MRIAVLTGEFPALSETFVINHVVSLLDRGHDVTVFAFKSDVAAGAHEVVRARGLDRIVRLLDPYIADSTVGRLLRRLGLLLRHGWREPGLTMRLLDPRIGGRAALNLSLFTYAQAFRHQGDFDVVHCHFGWFGLLGAKLKKAKAIRGKLVVTFHGADVNVEQAMGTPRQRELMFDVADGFTANTGFTRKQAMSLGCPPEKCSIWHMGVDVRLFEYRDRSAAAGDGIRLCTTGRLIEKKGIEYVIRALPLLNGGAHRVHFHVIGDGPLRPKLGQLARKLGVDGQVTFHGRCTSEAVRRLLDRAHLFVLASVTAENNDREGQGVALIEAEACGLPVIATHHNGFPEAVLDGESGFLVPERDPRALAERLQYLIDNPDVWGPMGRAGRRFVEEEFALDRCATVINSVYQQLVRSEK
jgi:colanic acid/amylovoran biosynthesis glycosyltransferase